MTEAAGAVYTEAQLRRYLERINFPSSKSLPEPTLENLRRLVAAHLEACPFENLSLHYSSRPKVDLDVEFIFDKFVNRRRGGYCMEQNRIFSIVLRSLGYDVYTVGGRVLQGLEWGKVTGWDHMAIILTLSGIEYLVDVGFGSGCLTAPLPIFNGSIIDEPASGVIPEEHRVHRAEIPGAGKKDHKIWMLQLRFDSNAEWRTQYIFEKDFEFFAPDYEVYFQSTTLVTLRMNMSTSQNPESLFRKIVVCTNVVYDGLTAVSRKILVNNEYKIRKDGKAPILGLFSSEQDRVDALKREFGITLSPEEIEGIKGKKTAVENFSLKGNWF